MDGNMLPEILFFHVAVSLTRFLLHISSHLDDMASHYNEKLYHHI